MRIAIFTEPFLPKVDGIVTMLTKTVESLRRRGDEVIIFAPSGGPDEIYGAKVVGLPSVRFVLYKELRLALPRASIRKELEAFKPDIIHLFEPCLLCVGGIYYSKVMKIPQVISAHTNVPQYVRYYKLAWLEGFTWWLMRQRHLRADLNVCPSTVMEKDLKEHGIQHVALWERAVDSDMFTPEARSEEMRARLSGGEVEKPLLLYVGRLSAEKDITSLREVLKALPGTRLAIVGDGPMRRELEKHFEGTPTVFTGYLRGKELASAYASADLFLFPSQTETLGLVLMEAMAAGCGVVACRAGGVPDAVEDGVTGFLFEPDDPKGLVNAAKRALGNKEELEAVRKRGREDVERHGWDQATEQLRNLYLETIQNYQYVKRPAGPLKLAVEKMTVEILCKLLP